MRLLDLIPFARKLSPSWTYAPGGTIWRMLPTSDGYLVGESRFDDEKKVEFFCIDLTDGKPVWEHKTMDESWWVGIEAVHEDMLFLHRFARPDMPEHAGIIAIDRSSGEIRWEEPYYQLLGVRDTRLVVRDHRTPDTPPVVLEIRTGKRVEPADEMPDAHADGVQDPEGIVYPSPIEPGGDGWQLFQKLLRGRSLIGSCEAAQVDDRWIFSYHASDKPAGESPSFEHRIAIAEGAGKVLYEDILHAEAHMPVYDAFFVRGTSVCFIRQERTLIAVDCGTA